MYTQGMKNTSRHVAIDGVLTMINCKEAFEGKFYRLA